MGLPRMNAQNGGCDMAIGNPSRRGLSQNLLSRRSRHHLQNLLLFLGDHLDQLRVLKRDLQWHAVVIVMDFGCPTIGVHDPPAVITAPPVGGTHCRHPGS